MLGSATITVNAKSDMNQNITKKVIPFALLMLSVVIYTQSSAQTRPLPPVKRVAIVTDGPSERADTLRVLFLDEIRAVNSRSDP